MLPRDIVKLIADNRIKSPRDLVAFSSTCRYWQEASATALQKVQRERILRRCHYLLQREVDRRTQEQIAKKKHLPLLFFDMQENIEIHERLIQFQKNMEFYGEIQNRIKTLSTFEDIFNLMRALFKHALTIPDDNALNFALIVSLREIIIMDFPGAYRDKISGLMSELISTTYIQPFNADKERGLCIDLQLLCEFIDIGRNVLGEFSELSSKRKKEIRALIKASAPHEASKHSVCHFVPEQFQSWFAIVYIYNRYHESLIEFDRKAYQAELANNSADNTITIDKKRKI